MLGQNEHVTDLLAPSLCLVDVDHNAAAEYIAENAAAYGNAMRAEEYDAGMIALNAGSGGVQIGGECRLVREMAPVSGISKKAQCPLDLSVMGSFDRRSARQCSSCQR